MSALSVVAEDLVRKYDKVVALEGINVSVKKGELFGFIGPDGAGKTSLFRILTTLLIPNSGYATVEGFDVVKDYKKIRNIIGYMPGRFSLYQDLSVEENLNFFASIFNTTPKQNYHLIKDIYQQIEPFKDRPAGKLSGGMKQKLALSCALIHKPEVLFLDEPTTGVDAVSRKEFWEMLKNLQNFGISIVVSTPYMDEASLCDRVALMQNGKIMKIDTPKNIRSEYPYQIAAVRTDNMYDIINHLHENKKVVSAFRFGDNIHISYNKGELEEQEIKTFLENKGHQIIRLNMVEADIEDCFMAFMNENKHGGI